MRDPARIDRILRKLRVIWKASPDLRLGQMLYHLIKGKALLSVVEDEPLEKLLDELAAKRLSAVDLLGHLTDGDGWMDEA